METITEKQFFRKCSYRNCGKDISEMRKNANPPNSGACPLLLRV